MIVLDASVLIAYLDADDAQHAAAEDLLAGTADDELGANALTLAEVLVAPARAGRLEQVRTVLRDLGIAELPFPAGSAVRLASLRATVGLRMPDCCVLLAAQEHAAPVASFDRQVRRAAITLGLLVAGE